MANLNLKMLLESANNRALHINASDTNWSNIDGGQLIVHHDGTASGGCEEVRPPQTPLSSVEPSLGSVDLRRGIFLDVKGTSNVFHFRGTVSTEMRLLLQNLAALSSGAESVSSAESREEVNPIGAPPIEDGFCQALVSLKRILGALPTHLAEQLAPALFIPISNVERR